MAVGPPSAVLEEQLFPPPQGPNVSPAGASQELRQPAVNWPWAERGLMQELGKVWLNPGMYEPPGSNFAARQEAQRRFIPGVAASGFWVFPELPMPPFPTGATATPTEGGTAGGAGSSIPNLLPLAQSVLERLLPQPTQSPGAGGGADDFEVNRLGTTGILDKPVPGPGDFPEFQTPGVLEGLQTGAVDLNDLVDAYGNLRWPGTSWETDTSRIAQWFRSRGIEPDQIPWLEGTPGLTGTTITPGQFSLLRPDERRLDTTTTPYAGPGSALPPIPGSVGGAIQGLGMVAGLPGMPEELREAARAAGTTAQAYQSTNALLSGNVAQGATGLALAALPYVLDAAGVNRNQALVASTGATLAAMALGLTNPITAMLLPVGLGLTKMLGGGGRQRRTAADAQHFQAAMGNIGALIGALQAGDPSADYWFRELEARNLPSLLSHLQSTNRLPQHATSALEQAARLVDQLRQTPRDQRQAVAQRLPVVGMPTSAEIVWGNTPYRRLYEEGRQFLGMDQDSYPQYSRTSVPDIVRFAQELLPQIRANQAEAERFVPPGDRGL